MNAITNTARISLNLAGATARGTGRAALWLLLLAWAFTKWTGRVWLWVFLFPVGVLRSVNHGANKRQKRHLDALREMHAETLQAQQKAA